MTLNFLSPQTLLLLCFVFMLHCSCSKDSDLLTDYVLSETEETLLNAYLVDDSFTVSRQSSLVLDVLSNDNLGNQENVEIIDATEPANGTVVVNEDDTITYTPDADLTEEVEDSFTYTVEVANDDATVSTETGNVTVTVSEDSQASKQFDFNVKDYGAKGDGVTDDVKAIQAAIDAASASGTSNNKSILFIPSGTYMVSKTGVNRLFMRENLIIQGEGAASIIKTEADSGLNWGSILSCRDIDNWEIRDITIDGNGGDSNLGGGDAVDGNHQKGITNIYIINCSNWVIDGYTGQNSWYGNVTINDINNFKFTNNRTINMDFGILSSGGSITNGIINDNYFEGHHWSEPIALFLGNVDNVQVMRNEITNKGYAHAILIGRADRTTETHNNILIKDNIINKANGGIGMLGGINTNVVVTGNSLYVENDGITFNNCTTCSITDNTVDTGWGGVPESAAGANYVGIDDSETGGQNAIDVNNSDNVSIINNTINQYGWSCVKISGSSNIEDKDNSCVKRL